MQVGYHAYRLFWGAVDLIFPPVCAGCGKLGTSWCDACHQKVVHLPESVCDVCGKPEANASVCLMCQGTRPPFAKMRSWAVFKPPLQNALHSLKYRRNIGLGQSLANVLDAQIKKLGWQIDTVIPIPLSKQRFGERGYNQVAVFAYPLACMNQWQYVASGLQRVRNTRSQVGLSRDQRRENVSGAFEATMDLTGNRVLLLDDVITTGATTADAARALRKAGASDVYVYSVAQALIELS